MKGKQYYFLGTVFLILLFSTATTVNGAYMVEVGDTFDYTLDQYKTVSGEASTRITETEWNPAEDGNGSLSIKAGESFTVTIISIESKTVIGEIKKGSNTGEFELSDFWLFENLTDQRATLEEQKSYVESDTENSGSFTIIENDNEIGYTQTSKYSYSETDGSSSSDSTDKYLWDKSTGMLLYVKSIYTYTYIDSGITETETFVGELRQTSYSVDNTDSGVSLPGFEFWALASLLVIIPLRRNK